jgi:uncharacterized glyoxalase superfamily protein PhnB
MTKKVNPIPPGFHTVTPHLVIRDAAKAIDFYKKAFGAEEICRMPFPPSGKIMHAEIKIGDSIIMLADEFPDMGDGCASLSPQALSGTSVTIHLYVTDADKFVNQAVAAGAKVLMPLMDMFWGDRYGKISDPFGHEWSVATHKEDLTPEEMGKRAEAAMAEFAPK